MPAPDWASDHFEDAVGREGAPATPPVKDPPTAPLSKKRSLSTAIVPDGAPSCFAGCPESKDGDKPIYDVNDNLCKSCAFFTPCGERWEVLQR